jgi:hypothetical protein
MSKRAKELMRQMTPVIIEALANRHNMTGADEKIEALIDAELRKERSRCADKAIDWFDDGTYIDADSRDRLHDELRAAILAEEED